MPAALRTSTGRARAGVRGCAALNASTSLFGGVRSSGHGACRWALNNSYSSPGNSRMELADPDARLALKKTKG
jgi:hypothetical protein